MSRHKFVTQIVVRIDAHERDALARISEAEGRTVAQTVRLAVRRYIAEQEGTQP